MGSRRAPRTAEQGQVRQMLRECLEALGCRRMVVGHTPQERINCMPCGPAFRQKDRNEGAGAGASRARRPPNPSWIAAQEQAAAGSAGLRGAAEDDDTGHFGPCIWRFDTGVSTYYGGQPEVLELGPDGSARVLLEGGSHLAGSEREPQH